MMIRKLNTKRFLSADYLGVYVGAIAFLFSQMPPIYEWCAEAKPKLSVNNMFALSHFLGRPELHLPITITNDGSLTFTAEKVTCELEHLETGHTWCMRTTIMKIRHQRRLDIWQQSKRLYLRSP